MPVCSLDSSAFVSDSTNPISASMTSTTGRLIVTNSAVFTSPACPRLQPHCPLHHTHRPRGQASARPISPRQASSPPQVFDTPGAKSHRTWRKLHLAVDAANGMIVAQTLTDQDADDPSQVGPLLDQIDDPIVQVTADGAYDGAPTYQTIAAHGDEIEVVIPPRSTAVPSGEPGPPTQRDRHLAMIAEQGRLAWQATTG